MPKSIQNPIYQIDKHGNITESVFSNKKIKDIFTEKSVNDLTTIISTSYENFKSLSKYLKLDSKITKLIADTGISAEVTRHSKGIFLKLNKVISQTSQELELKTSDCSILTYDSKIILIDAPFQTKNLLESLDLKYLTDSIDKLWLALFLSILDHLISSPFPILNDLRNTVEDIEVKTTEGSIIPSEDIAKINMIASKILCINDAAMKMVNEMSNKLLLNDDKKIVLLFKNIKEKIQDIQTSTAYIKTSIHEIISLNSMHFSEKQNEDMKRISAWAALLVIPSIIGSIYGMNFENMPGLSWKYGYFLTLLIMLLFTALMFYGFRKKKWI